MTDASLKMKVSLQFSATDVPAYDTFSASDPVVFVYQKLFPKGSNTPVLNKVGRTEPLLDSPNPKWAKQVVLNYEFEAVQHLRFCIYDVDDPKNVDDLSKQEIIGYVDITLGQLMSAPNSSLKLEVFKENSTTEKHTKMRFVIQAQEVVESRMWASGQIRGLNLKKHGFFSHDDTSLEFVKSRGATTNVFYQSPTIPKNNKDPLYAPFNVGLGSVFQGVDDLATTMTIRVVRVRRNDYKSRIVIGEVTLPVSDFIKQLEDQKRIIDIKDGNSVTGQIEILFFKIEELPTFLDYVRAGLTFRLFVHIDFTASNANGPKNLHQIQRNQMNEYQLAIRSVGDVLASYTRSSSIHASGYGALVSIDGKPKDNNFCFPLTLSTQRWYVQDVNELLYAYDYAIKNLTLSGPTMFAPGITHVEQYCKEPFTPTFQHFNILLIITDGVINDMAATTDAIVAASQGPLAIIIVGVGNANFEAMSVLDGDEVRLKSQKTGQVAIRDIVQFVPMQSLAHDQAAISEATLQEIPDTVLSFFRLHKIKPLDIPQFNRLSTGGGTPGYEYKPPTQ